MAAVTANRSWVNSNKVAFESALGFACYHCVMSAMYGVTRRFTCICVFTIIAVMRVAFHDDVNMHLLAHTNMKTNVVAISCDFRKLIIKKTLRKSHHHEFPHIVDESPNIIFPYPTISCYMPSSSVLIPFLCIISLFSLFFSFYSAKKSWL
jgi:hypothetical protein